MKSILDPSFKYVPSTQTDIRKTFARVRREARTRERPGREDAPRNISPYSPGEKARRKPWRRSAPSTPHHRGRSAGRCCAHGSKFPAGRCFRTDRSRPSTAQAPAPSSRGTRFPLRARPWRVAAAGWRIRRMSKSHACCAISAAGWRITDRCGVTSSAHSGSSNPRTETSCGQRTAIERNAPSTSDD